MKTPINALLFVSVLLFAVSPSTAAEKERTDSVHEDVALFMLYHYGGGMGRIQPWTVVETIVWKDGRVLAGTCVSEEKRDNSIYMNWEYRYGKIDTKKIEPLAGEIAEEFRLEKKDAYIMDLGPEATYHDLKISFGREYLDIETWEIFSNAKPLSRSEVLAKGKTTDGKPLYLPEFYATWKNVKRVILDLGSSPSLKDAVDVDVSFDEKDRNKIIIRDKAGKVLVEQALMQERRAVPEKQ